MLELAHPPPPKSSYYQSCLGQVLETEGWSSVYGENLSQIQSSFASAVLIFPPTVLSFSKYNNLSFVIVAFIAVSYTHLTLPTKA